MGLNGCPFIGSTMIKIIKDSIKFGMITFTNYL